MQAQTEELLSEIAEGTVMNKIDGIAKSVSDILKGKKYRIDYYQREYKWESKQLQELVIDLTGKFEEAWDPAHPREQVDRYPYYFLGSIIISEKDTNRYLVDGQQRLTSLTLLLIFLRHLQQDRGDEVNIDELISSVMYGRRSFNLEIEDREECMSALFEHGVFDPDDNASESVKALVARYSELEDVFPEEVRGAALPFFIDWLQHRVQVVQITAYADEDAYTIFETMNDRGLKLTPADMLKGYLLTNIDEGELRKRADGLWRRHLQELADREKDADSDFLKTWLRSQYARKIRERKKSARPEDWDRIGTEFHRWLRDNTSLVELTSSTKFFDLVQRDFSFYSRQYLRIIDAASWRSMTPGLEFIGYNADRGFTLQHQLLLAPLRPGDTADVIDTKLKLVAKYVDILLARRIWNFRSIAYSTMQYAMFIVMRNIRRLGVDELAKHLHASLAKESETFDNNDRLRMHQQNRYQLHRLLARITDYVGTQSGEASKYLELTNNKGVRYEVEHIWADRPERHTDEFTHAHDFDQHRNLIGDLLLLPRDFNASYGDDTYEQKLPHYLMQNILARSLHPQCYERNPGFRRFLDSTSLPFKPYSSFKSADVVERGNLYREIAKIIWNPDDLLNVVNQSS